MTPTFRLLCAALLAALAGPALAVGSLADISIYDRSDGRPLQVYWHEGRAWVVGKPGNEYAVRLRNRAGDDILAVVSVDGVNVVTGETASPQQSGYVLSPWRDFELAGWRKNLSATAAFYFTSLPDSYAARTGRPDNVGVIGVALYRKKPQPQPLPADVAPLSRQAPAASPRAEASRDAGPSAFGEAREAQKLGTGHGRTEASPARYVGFERATPYPVETVSLHYDRYENLVARGIIREPRPVPLPRPLPRPFPGFVPDPPA